MTESKICTCPSGDGSLVHPCQAHPAVEQAGGDRWDALQSILEWTASENIPDERKLCLIRNAARAALAQPSPVRSSLLINGYQLRAALDFIAPDGTAEQLESEACIEWRQQDADFLEAGLYAFCAEYPEEGGVLLDEEPTTAQPSPLQSEQAEAERPEVVARVVHSNPVVLGQCGPLNANDELMTVAQHAASVARWAEMFNRVEQERDAALARVADLERQEPVATVAKVPGEDWNSLDFHRDLQHMQPGTKLYAAPVAQAQQLHDLDKQCRDDVARALGLRPNQERGFAWSYLLASIKSCVKASGDSAQAQHSVPAYVSYTTQPAESLAGIALRQLKDESRWVEIRDINAHAFPDMRSHSYYPAGTVIKLPAAAPGKEGA
ncbi:LysM peptidoglycan-binding domain-containing protein [Pseudomonas aeruginosa]|uniref:LysM peptidoglycan-binding domain-containing protein n=1 Tax=Pseudomonas aeruginosa TaxID=287 RepID=UPI0015951609|nr:hypothetical protein [Pseudomonas aeruginosa]